MISPDKMIIGEWMAEENPKREERTAVKEISNGF